MYDKANLLGCSGSGKSKEMSSSSKGSTDIDWCAHREDFMVNHAPSGVSARKYFSEQGLNVNSGRRQFTAIAKLEVEGMTYDAIRLALFSKSSASPKAGSKSGSKGGSKSGSTKRDPLPKKTTRSTSPAKKSIKNKEVTQGKAERTPATEKKKTKNTKRLTTPLQQEFIDRSSDMQSVNRGRFAAGNTAAVKTGAYMNLVHAQSDIVDTVLNCRLGDVSGLVKLSEIRYIQMERLLVDRLVDIERRANDGNLPLDHNNQPISKEDLIREAYWGSSSVLTGLLGTLTMAHTQASKAEVDNEIKMGRYLKEKTDREFLINLSKEREANEDMTALEMARRIEAYGLSPSPIIAAEALKEIELMRPKVDTSGISEEELDAKVESYMQKVKTDVDAMSSRRDMLEILMLQSKAELEAGGLEEEDFQSTAYSGLEHDDDIEDVEFSGIDESDDTEWSD